MRTRIEIRTFRIALVHQQKSFAQAHLDFAKRAKARGTARSAQSAPVSEHKVLKRADCAIPRALVCLAKLR